MNARASASVQDVMRPFHFLFLTCPLVLVSATASAQAATFDREAAAKALDRDFDACLPDDASVRIVVTFAPSGAIDTITEATWGATVGTLKAPKVGPVPDSVTSCVRSKLDGVQIPAFAGPPVRVGKKIDISARTGCAEVVVGSGNRWFPLFIDGRNVGTTLLQTRVWAGEHELMWQRPDGSFARHKYTFKCGHRLTFMLYADRDPDVADRRLVSLEDARRRGAVR